MKKFWVLLLFLGVFLSACAPANEFQGKNPKTAGVEIGDGEVVISIPKTTPYFRLENVQDDSVVYKEILFRYDSELDIYEIRTDLDEWRTVSPEETFIQMGQVLIEINVDFITVAYPSGTWAFP